MTAFDFWLVILMSLLFYTYAGYPMILRALLFLKPQPRSKAAGTYLPTVSLLVAAWNEADILEEKIRNCRSLNYPLHRLQLIFVTDGSSDETLDIMRHHKNILHFHNPERKGKTAAIKRILPFIDTDIIVFTDANSMLNADAIQLLVGHFQNPEIGCVAGEKRIWKGESLEGSTFGEGLYWRYESWLKKMDAQLSSCAGAAGELYAIRRELVDPPAEHLILDDFRISLGVIQKGFRIQYEPDAYAFEQASSDLTEELKRKIRICSGAFQLMGFSLGFLNIFKYGLFSWQFASHRLLRWTLAPLALLALMPVAVLGAVHFSPLSLCMLIGQIMLLITVWLGWRQDADAPKRKLLIIPLYFYLMHYAALAGFTRYYGGNASVKWEKARRLSQ